MPRRVLALIPHPDLLAPYMCLTGPVTAPPPPPDITDPLHIAPGVKADVTPADSSRHLVGSMGISTRGITAGINHPSWGLGIGGR